MKKARPAIMSLLRRCLTLSCPVCGRASIVASPFQIKHYCPDCRALFKREDGFFVGAIMVNVMTTEAMILLFYLVWLAFFSFDERLLLRLLILIAVLFPPAFYHHSWSLWLSFDHLIERLPEYQDQYLTRGRSGV